jgi:hypothetical protein
MTQPAASPVRRAAGYLVAGATVTAVVGAAVIFGMGVAKADPSYSAPADDQYLACVARADIYSTAGGQSMIDHGRQIASDIDSGYRTEQEEIRWVYRITPRSVRMDGATAMVLCAITAYLTGPADGSPGGNGQIGTIHT